MLMNIVNLTFVHSSNCPTRHSSNISYSGKCQFNWDSLWSCPKITQRVKVLFFASSSTITHHVCTTIYYWPKHCNGVLPTPTEMPCAGNTHAMDKLVANSRAYTVHSTSCNSGMLLFSSRLVGVGQTSHSFVWANQECFLPYSFSHSHSWSPSIWFWKRFPLFLPTHAPHPSPLHSFLCATRERGRLSSYPS